MKFLDPDEVARTEDTHDFERIVRLEEVVEHALRDMRAAPVARVDRLDAC